MKTQPKGFYLAVKFAPLATKSSTTFKRLFATASCNGVSLSSPGILIKASWSKNSLTISTWPWLHASCWRKKTRHKYWYHEDIDIVQFVTGVIGCKKYSSTVDRKDTNVNANNSKDNQYSKYTYLPGLQLHLVYAS